MPVDNNEGTIMGQGTKKIYFWRGIIGLEALMGAYGDTINKLLNRDYKAADLKKLSGHSVYSARVNDTHRLLFTSIKVDGQSYLLFLEVILNHDYQKSRFLKPKVLKRYLDQHAKAAVGQELEAHFEEASEGPMMSSTEEESDEGCQIMDENSFSCEPVEYFNHQLIALNAGQNEVREAQMPVLVTGGPGSGKSCAAMSLLRQCSQPHCLDDEGELGRVLYLANSTPLVNSMRSLWLEDPCIAGGREVLFKTYRELACEIKPELNEMIEVQESEFKVWFKAFQKKKNAPVPDALNNPRHLGLLYQELRIVAGHPGGEYEDLGGRQSLICGKKERLWVLDVFKLYLAYLEDNKQYDLSFSILNTSTKFQVVIADEAQDFSHHQLRVVYDLAQGANVCFCMDTHQSLFDNQSKRPFLLQIPGIKHIQLPFSYRCPRYVRQMANAVIATKNQLTGGLADKQELIRMEPVADEEGLDGTVLWIERPNEKEMDSLIQEAKHAHFAVITLEHLKRDASALFETGLVFTTEEIKGLEYKTIVAYGLLDEGIFVEASRKLQAIAQSRKDRVSIIHRPKNGDQDDVFGPCFNQIFTAFTRAMQTLVIIQEHTHANTHVVSQLKAALPNRPCDMPQNKSPIHRVAQRNEWALEAQKLLHHGNIDQARAVFIGQLGQDPNQFDAWKQAQLDGRPTDFSPRASVMSLAEEENQDKVIKARTPSPPQGKSRQRKKSQEQTSRSVSPVQPIIVKKPIPERIMSVPDRNKIEIDYVTNLFERLSIGNLELLFNHKNLQKWLFHVRMDKNMPLISHIFMGSRKTQIFLNFLKADRNRVFLLYNAITAPVVEPYSTQPLYWMCNQGPLAILIKLINTNPLIIKQITPEMLYAPLESAEQFRACESAFFALVKSHKGTDFLLDLLIQNKGLFGPLLIEALNRPLTVMAGYDANTSPFYWLSCSGKGRNMITKLYKLYPDVLHQLHVDALCRPLTDKHENESAFYYLSSNDTGISILLELFNTNSRLVEQITGESLCRKLVLSESFEHESVLYSLSKNPERRDILLLLLAKNPGLARQITLKALCQKLPENAGEDANASAFLWLCSASDGLVILEKLFHLNPELAEELPIEALCRPLTAINLRHENETPLYHLCLSCKGFALLLYLFNKNPALTMNLNAFSLGLQLGKGSGFNRNQSPLHLLSAFPSGRQFLLFLMKKNPVLAKSIPLEALCVVANTNDDERGRVSVHKLLREDDTGLAVLNLLSSAVGIRTVIRIPPALSKGMIAPSDPELTHADNQNGFFTQVQDKGFFSDEDTVSEDNSDISPLSSPVTLRPPGF